MSEHNYTMSRKSSINYGTKNRKRKLSEDIDTLDSDEREQKYILIKC